MFRTSSSLAPEASSSTGSSTLSQNQNPSSTRISGETLRKTFPRISWLTEGWLAQVIPYERIATASPRLGVGVIGQHLLEHHINLLPNLSSDADFIPVSNEVGTHVGYRAKIATWPLTEQDELKLKGHAAW